MSQRIAYLEAVVGADISNYRRQMAEVRNDMGFLAENFRGLGRVAQQMSFAVSLPIAAIGSAMVNVGMQFDESMRNVNSIAQLSEQSFQDLSQEVLNFSKTTKAGATEAANALYEVFSAGVADTATAMEIMQVAVHTSEAGLADLAATTKGITALTLAYSNSNYQAADASNMLTRTVQVGVGPMDEFVNNLGRVAPISAALGINAEELGASWAFMTQRGTTASRAATEMAAVMKGLLKPSSDLETVINSLGAATGKELIANMGGFKETIEAIWQAAGNSEAVLAEWFPDARQIRGLTKIVNDTEAWSQAIEEFNTNLDEATSSALEEQQKSLAYQFGRVTSAAEAFAVTVSQKLQPALMPIAKHIENFFHGLSSLEPEILQVGIAMATLLMVLPPLLWLFASMMNPIGLLVTALGGLATAFAINFGGIQDKVIDAVKSILGDEGFAALESGIQSIVDILNHAFTGVNVDDPLQEVGQSIETSQENWSSQITVEKGDTAWTIWADHYRNEFDTFEEWLESTDLENAALIIEGQVIKMNSRINEAFQNLSITSGGTSDIPVNSRSINRGNMLTSGFEQEQIAEEDIGFFGRLIEGIEAELPNIQQAFSDVFTAISNYVINEGIPALSKAAGQAVGSMAATLVNGFATIVTFINNGGLQKAGGDFNLAVEELATYFEDNVGQPFIDGFEQGFEGTITEETKTTMEAIKTDIADKINNAIVGINELIDDVETALQPTVDSIENGLGIIKDSIENNEDLRSLADGISYLLGAFTSGVEGVSISDELQPIADALSSFFSTLQEAINDFKENTEFNRIIDALVSLFAVIGKIATVIVAGALIAITAGIKGFIGAIASLIESGGNTLSSFIETLSSFFNTIDSLLGVVTGEVPFIDFLDDLKVTILQFAGAISAPVAAAIDAVTAFLGAILGFEGSNLSAQVAEAVREVDEGVKEGLSGSEIMTDEADRLLGLDTSTWSEGGTRIAREVTESAKAEFNKEGFFGRLITAQNELVTGGLENVDPAQAQADIESELQNIYGGVDAIKNIFTMDADEVKQSVKDTLGDPLADAITESIDQEGFTATPIVENFINVIDEAWVGAFGETGTTRLAWSGFVTELTNSIDTVTGAIVIMALTVPITLGTMYTLSLIPLNAMIGKLGELTEAIGGVSGALGSLTNNPLIQLMLGGNVVASGLMPANAGGGANGGGDTYNVTSYGTSPRELVTTMEKANNSTGTGNWSP